MERLDLKEVQKLEGHTDRVWSLDWNPATGHAGIPLVFASCSGDKTVRIWEQNLSTNLFSCKVPLSLSLSFLLESLFNIHVYGGLEYSSKLDLVSIS